MSHEPAESNRARELASRSDTAPFHQAAQLDQALDATPDVRPDVVQRGRELVKNVHYPSMETMRQIATLLAIHLNTELP
jgi:hypothetical protein